jgi:NAD(P)H dehydrogenase (quinone)
MSTELLIESFSPARVSRAKKLAVVYHSAHGHTEHIARQVRDGATQVPGTEADLRKAVELAETPDELLAYDGYILGSPT